MFIEVMATLKYTATSPDYKDGKNEDCFVCYKPAVCGMILIYMPVVQS